MRIERSKVKIVVSKNDYEKLENAKIVIEEMRNELYNEDEDGLDFFGTLTQMADDLGELIYAFESTKYEEYYAEVE